MGALMGRHHQYPDGAVLFLGTMFAPVEDRGAPGKGFTHEIGRRRDHLGAPARRAGEPDAAGRPIASHGRSARAR